MTSDHSKLIRGTIDQATFDRKLVAEKQKFQKNLESKVKKLLPDEKLPQIGIFEILIFKNSWFLRIIMVFRSKKDVIFISHPENDKEFNGYKHLMENIARSLSMVTS